MGWEIEVSSHLCWSGQVTAKVESVMRMFGVDMERLRQPLQQSLRMQLGKGEVCFITGPSGSGKSVLLDEVRRQLGGESLEDFPLPSDKAVIDCIEGEAVESLRVLNAAGLNDVFAVLNRAGQLSEGQRYRLKLAMAMSKTSPIVYADEFCSTLDRLTASVIAWNLRKLATRTGKTFVLASSHDDIIADLRPDLLVVKDLTGGTKVVRSRCQRASL